MIQITPAHNDARLAATLSFLDSGTTGAKVQLYAGERPALGEAAPGALLVEIELPRPAGSIVANTLALSPAEGMVLVSGVAAWARVITGAGALAWDCDVSDLDGTGEIRLNQVQLYAGGIARLTSGQLG